MNTIKIGNQTGTCHKSSTLFDGYFTADNLIDAYVKGLESYGNLPHSLSTAYNLLKKSGPIIRKFYDDHLKENKCFSIFMRLIVDKVDFIIALEDNIYFDENKCRPLYATASTLMIENRDISISFMPCKNESEINRMGLKADNYIEIV